MLSVIREAGWPIFPIMILGACALAAALRHAFFPQRSLVPLIAGMAAACAVMGVLGTALGVQHSIRGITDADPSIRWYVLLGLREALNCLDVSLLFVFLALLAGLTGSYRMATRIEAIAQRNG